MFNTDTSFIIAGSCFISSGSSFNRMIVKMGFEKFEKKKKNETYILWTIFSQTLVALKNSSEDTA